MNTMTEKDFAKLVPYRRKKGSKGHSLGWRKPEGWAKKRRDKRKAAKVARKANR